MWRDLPVAFIFDDLVGEVTNAFYHEKNNPFHDRVHDAQAFVKLIVGNFDNFGRRHRHGFGHARPIVEQGQLADGLAGAYLRQRMRLASATPLVSFTFPNEIM